MRYFIDTNLIIDAYEKKKPEAINKLKPILENEESEFFVNRLVFLETLRTVKITHHKNFQELKEVFAGFDVLDINQAIYDQAIELSRYCQSKGVTLKGGCAAIDFVHFTTAKYYELEMLANDGDMEKLADIYPAFLSSKSSA